MKKIGFIILGTSSILSFLGALFIMIAIKSLEARWPEPPAFVWAAALSLALFGTIGFLLVFFDNS